MVDTTGTNYLIPRMDQPLVDENGMITRSWYNYFSIVSTMNISSGDGAPTFVPKKVGDEYLDLTNEKLYKSFGVTDLSDWILIN